MCPSCHGFHFTYRGAGTQKIEEELYFKVHGREEAYRVALKNDELVAKAKDLLSQAESFEDLFNLASRL